ncbi:MAG: hypothetical protein ISR65_16030 [Bacteriovoracaceae bacterium]|nr:hypothetical protein [Bacteriovoracaceae bacterium]
MQDDVKCRDCVHFYITWDQANPMGCRLFKFKSKSIPSQVVKKESNQQCQAFKPKEGADKSESSVDLNDDKLW